MDSSRIITVTLSPSLDRTITTRYLTLGYHNLAEGPMRLDPAGAGVSVSRALHRLRFPTHALVLLGTDAVARAYEALVHVEDFPVTVVRADGRTRSHTIIHDSGHENETHLEEAIPPLSEEVLQRLILALEAIVQDTDTVLFAGPLPGVRPEDTFRRLVEVSNRQGARTVAAVGVEELEEMLISDLSLVTLTQLQAERLFNFPVRGPEEVAYCAGILRERGIPAVLVQMPDTASAYLSSADGGDWLVSLAEEETGTSSGIWEALLAGLLAGRSRRQPLDAALQLGAAAASYTAGQLGSEFGTAADIAERLPDVDVQRVEADEPEE